MPCLPGRSRRRGGDAQQPGVHRLLLGDPGTKCGACRMLMGQPGAWVPARPAAQLLLPSRCQATPALPFFLLLLFFFNFNFPSPLAHLLRRLNWVALLPGMLPAALLPSPGPGWPRMCRQFGGTRLGCALQGAQGWAVRSGWRSRSVQKGVFPFLGALPRASLRSAFQLGKRALCMCVGHLCVCVCKK